MSPTHKEYVYDFADLHLLGIVCKCGTELIIDLAAASPVKTPVQCGACSVGFDTPFWEALEAYGSVYKKLTAGGKTASARVRIRREVHGDVG